MLAGPLATGGEVWPAGEGLPCLPGLVALIFFEARCRRGVFVSHINPEGNSYLRNHLVKLVDAGAITWGESEEGGYTCICEELVFN